MGVIVRLGLKGAGTTLRNFDGLDKRLREKHKEWLYEGAKRIEKAAKEILQSRVNPIYSTGKLGGSIHTTFNPTEPQPYARVGPDMRVAPYAEWVEYGHFMVGGWGGGGGRWWEGHHYMRDAFLQERGNIMNSIEADLAHELKYYPYLGYDYKWELTYWGPRARSITTGRYAKGL